MMRFSFVIIFLILSALAVAQKSQAISYQGNINFNGISSKNQEADLFVKILQGNENGKIIYSERHHIRTDPTGLYLILIGDGRPVDGKFDSIIWSDGAFFLKIEADTNNSGNFSIIHIAVIRIAPQLGNDHEVGTVNSSDTSERGEWHFPNARHRRPKLITIDLTTSYANLAYPANTYPIYRHYEWYDPHLSGTGNAFYISYSEHTINGFLENTNKLGDVKLYNIPFQELTVSSTANDIAVFISKPVPVSNLSETYAIKGPWKFIYYIEW